jgi:hypothetical protein
MPPNSRRTVFPEIYFYFYLVFGVEVLSVLQTHFAHSHIADLETAFLDPLDYVPDVVQGVWLYHRESSKKIIYMHFYLEMNFDRVNSSA